MVERIVEMMDVVCYGGTLQQVPNADKIREEIVRCRDCYYCHEVGRFFVCKRFNYKIDTNTGEHEPRGFCAWGSVD